MKKMKKLITCFIVMVVAVSAMQPMRVLADTDHETISLSKIGSYVSGVTNADGGVAEIVSYDKVHNKAWVVNGATGLLDILHLSKVTSAESEDMPAESLNIKKLACDQVKDFVYGDMTSVSVNGEQGLAAVALQAEGYDQNGYVAVLSTDGEMVAMFEAGCQPDMVTFTPDGSKILVANEGEPREGYGENVTDPAGSVTVITLNDADVKASETVTIGFGAFDAQRDTLVANRVLMAKDANPSADFEPEYIACDDQTAYVALQENNAIAILDLASKTFTGVYSLGYKDLCLEENAIDLVEDGQYAVATYPNAVSAYMPDGISLYHAKGTTYLLTANEGDAREWGSDETEYVNEIKETLNDVDGNEAKKVRIINPEVTDGLPEGKHVLFGGRSFSIYAVGNSGLTQVFDSGNDFETLTAAAYPDYFNCSNDDNDFDSRSMKKGPEPESVVVGEIDGRTYAFTALERIGGIMVYDITNPETPVYCSYVNTRNFAAEPDSLDAGDVAPEGMYFIHADDSPSHTPILLAAFEVSGTVAAYAVGDVPTGDVPTGDNGETEEDNSEQDVTVNDQITDDEQMPNADDQEKENENLTQNQNVKDMIESAPETGDGSQFLFWAAIMIIVGSAGILIHMMRKERQL